MKTFLTKLKSSLVLTLALGSMSLWAKPVAQVTEVSGQVFSVSPQGQTVLLKANDHLDEKTEIMVEEGASISLNDYFDAKYHLIGGSHLKFFNKSVQLKRGKAWVFAQNSNHLLALTTANGYVSFSKGEFIATFDQINSRSQVLVVSGDVEVSNILEKDLKQTVSAGSFSLIDPEVENGVPRAATKVGLKSLNQALAEFKKLPKEMIEATPAEAKREIASVVTDAPKKGEITFITTNQEPVTVGAAGDALNYYKKSVTKKKVSKKSSTEAVQIHFYGMNPSTEQAPKKVVETNVVDAAREPASIKKSPLTSPKTNQTNITASEAALDQEFESSLKQHFEDQPKHSKELENLIQDLKSY